MSSLVKPASVEELKLMFTKVLLSRTDQVTKVTMGSVFNGVAFGVAKLAQKAMKDIALAQSHFLPDSAFGSQLDTIAAIYGISPRFSGIGSSTYIRVHADVGTAYIAGASTVRGDSGFVFDLDESVTVGTAGYAYIKVSSQSIGLSTNIDAFDIRTMQSAPAGHIYCTNEYAAFGGRNLETDDEFRERIKNSINLLANSTISMIEQVFMKINPAVMRVFNYGANQNGQVNLAILTQNGASLTQLELDELTESASKYLSFSDLNPNGFSGLGINLMNAVWFPVDISFRLIVNPNFDPVKVRKQIQIRISKYFDYRDRQSGDKVEWDDLLEIVKSTEGVDYVFDNYFFPNSDLQVPFPKLPRPRGFLMLDESGAPISDGTENFNPIYYPNALDFNIHANTLANI